MTSIPVARRVKVSADGRGVVSHAGMGRLRELVRELAGAVFADLAAAVADGADCIDGVGRLCGDREHAFGAKASTTTCGGWSMSASTPPTFGRFAAPARRRGQRPGLPAPHHRLVSIYIDRRAQRRFRRAPRSVVRSVRCATLTDQPHPLPAWWIGFVDSRPTKGRIREAS